MRRLLGALLLLALASRPASAQQNCITINGIQQCASALRLFDTTARQGVQPVLDLTQTWINAGVTFTGVRLNITDTNSASGSLLLDLQKGGVSQFKVDKSGNFTPVGAGLFPDGTAALPGMAFASQPSTGFLKSATSTVQLSLGGAATYQFGSTFFAPSLTMDFTNGDVVLARGAANTLNLRNGANAQTIQVGPTPGFVNITSTNIVTAPTDSTAVEAGGLTHLRSSSTITPATAGVGNCGAAFQAAALTADCTIATLPAGMKLLAIYADVTVGFTCSGTCTGTKVMQAGTAAGGTQVLAAALNVAATGQFGLADADLGSGMTRAAAIQGGLIGSWSATTPISVRFTSGTGNWGSGAATFVNAGSVKFILITEQIK